MASILSQIQNKQLKLLWQMILRLFFSQQNTCLKTLSCLTLFQVILLFVKIADLHKHLALKVVRKLEKVESI
jgi:hypothetical protein